MQATRARIGLIIPSGNTLTEPQFQRYAPAGVQCHITRLRKTHHAPLEELLPGIIEAACCLADARCDVIAFHCTAGAMEAGIEGGKHLIETLEQATGRRCITTATAVLAAFEALGVRSVTLVSPYARSTNEEEIAFLTQAGIQVLRDHALEVPRSPGYPSVSAESWLQLALEYDDCDADASFLSCTNIHSLPVLEQIESRLRHRPVVASNQATLWYCLRLCGLDDSVPGLGRLMQLGLPVAAGV
jgi:arylmalonate decarboxylase